MDVVERKEAIQEKSENDARPESLIELQREKT